MKNERALCIFPSCLIDTPHLCLSRRSLKLNQTQIQDQKLTNSRFDSLSNQFCSKDGSFIELGTIYIQGAMVCLLDLKVQSCAPFIPILVLSHQTCSSLRRCSLTFSFITVCMCDMGNHKAKRTRNKLRNEQKRQEKQVRMSSIFSLLWTKRKILAEI